MDFKIKNRHRLKSKEIRSLFDEIINNFMEDFFDDNFVVETGKLIDNEIVIIDNDICFMKYKDNLFFTLIGINKFKPKNKFVVVDMGAVKFVTNGADVMAPGIVDADEKIEKNNQVWICDQRNRQPLAVGVSLMNGLDMVNSNKDKSVEVVHHVGDRLWNIFRKSL